ncbi:apoptosis-stimulating of p53 protein 2-like [Pseudochaenichthys georgianus]|uniref:apoptosis-stimulating of p53 protein 2-like n=1 Tax=Pseudochaenichthys georgianus TaxID=52239 RepID=UPI00146A614A|nr:apoptosis-stimulating of p53 protein 2-like [Pseudochaenichthys georgianus]
MMPMFLTVYLSNNDQHFNEVPITPETLCRDVVELCKEPGEGECYLAEMWRGSEHIVGDGERMFEVLQKCGQQRGEVRYLLRHQSAPGRESAGYTPLDYCNALLIGIPSKNIQKLQYIQNTAARILMRVRSTGHITPTQITALAPGLTQD